MRRFKLLFPVMVAAIALIAVTVVAEAPGESAPGAPDKAAQSADLARAPSVQASPLANTGERLSPAQARSLADSLRQQIPLPEGGNYNGIQFEAAGGDFTAGEVETVAQFNAACQWLVAKSAKREAAVADKVLADVPNWSAIRGLGFPADDPRQLDECLRTAANQSAYATARGLIPAS